MTSGTVIKVCLLYTSHSKRLSDKKAVRIQKSVQLSFLKIKSLQLKPAAIATAGTTALPLRLRRTKEAHRPMFHRQFHGEPACLNKHQTAHWFSVPRFVALFCKTDVYKRQVPVPKISVYRAVYHPTGLYRRFAGVDDLWHGSQRHFHDRLCDAGRHNCQQRYRFD